MDVTVIPATRQAATSDKDKYHQLRVAAYCRVSTAQEEQQNSYQVQIDYYTEYINKNKDKSFGSWIKILPQLPIHSRG